MLLRQGSVVRKVNNAIYRIVKMLNFNAAHAIFGGKRQLPPKINHWRQKIAADNFTNICVNNASLLNSYIFLSTNMITILLICSLLDIK